jgi:uncharacterized protein (TIGR00369 family)
VTGLEFLTSIANGETARPPIMSTLGFDGLAVGPGWARFTMTPSERHYNPIGSVHGGVAATLLDSAMGCAVHSTLGEGVGYTTVDLNVKFVRPLTAETGPIRCEGSVVHAGSRVATAEGRIVDARGKLYAHALTTCLILGGAA